MNVYSYCHGNPVMGSDPSGLACDEDSWAPACNSMWGSHDASGIIAAEHFADSLLGMVPYQMLQEGLRGKDCWDCPLSQGDQWFRIGTGAFEVVTSGGGEGGGGGAGEIGIGGDGDGGGGTGFMPDEGGGFGDLTPGEIARIQDLTDEAGRPIHIVGSTVDEGRRGVSLPVGPGETPSDIDYVIPPSSVDYWRDLWDQLPGLDPGHGPIIGIPNPYIGPSISFEPRL